MIILTMVGCIVVMFSMSFISVSDTQDRVTQVAIQQYVSDFVNTAARKGKITRR